MTVVSRLLVLIAIAGQVKFLLADDEATLQAAPACWFPPCEDIHVNIKITGLDYWDLKKNNEKFDTFTKLYAESVANTNYGMNVPQEHVRDMADKRKIVTVSYGGASGSTAVDCIVSISINRTQQACARLKQPGFYRYVQVVTKTALGDNLTREFTSSCEKYAGGWMALTTAPPREQATKAPTPQPSLLPTLPPTNFTATPAPTSASVGSPFSRLDSIWTWLVPGLIVACISVVACFLCKDKCCKPKRPAKKRALKETVPLKLDIAPSPSSIAPSDYSYSGPPSNPHLVSALTPPLSLQYMPVQLASVQVPVPVTTAVPVHTYTTAMPVAMVPNYGVPAVRAQSPIYVQSPNAPPMSNSFDLIDTFHDGTMGREQALAGFPH